MAPNYQIGQYYLTNEISYRFNHPQRGDVIAFASTRHFGQVNISRIIGLPGENILIKSGQIYINNSLLLEPYLPPSTETTPGKYLPEGQEVTLGQNQYFVMGDNRSGSEDSRSFGPISGNSIIGKFTLRYH